MEQSDRLHLNEELLTRLSQRPYSRRQALANWLFPRVDTISTRRIDHRRHVSPSTFFSNKVDNSKSNFLTFLPRVFFNNFKHFLNLYFLVLCVLQFFPVFQVGYLVSYVLPIVIILAVSVVRDFIDERQIRRKDEALNSERYTCLHQPFGPRRGTRDPQRPDSSGERGQGAQRPARAHGRPPAPLV